MYRTSRSGSVLQGLALYALIAYGISSWLRISWLLAFAATILAVILLVLLGYLVVRVFSGARKFIQGFSRCPHGLRHPSISHCAACEKAEEEKRKAYERECAERQRLERLKKEAAALRDAEILRLSKAWQSASASYFAMDDRTFEDAISELFRKLGYSVKQTPYSNDGGKDAIASRDGKKYVIECKRYREAGVTSRRDLQILLAAMHDEKADGAVFISTGRFSANAIEYGRLNGIELYDHAHLPILVNRAYGPSAEMPPAKVMCTQCGGIVAIDVVPGGYKQSRCPAYHLVTSNIRLDDLSVVFSLETPACPKCNSSMRIVKGRMGTFWGCSRYPKCHSTMRIRKRGEDGRGHHHPKPSAS